MLLRNDLQTALQDVEVADVIGEKQHELRIDERALRVVEAAMRVDERLVEVVGRGEVGRCDELHHEIGIGTILRWRAQARPPPSRDRRRASERRRADRAV